MLSVNEQLFYIGDYNISEQLYYEDKNVPTFKYHKKFYTLKRDLDRFMKK